MQVPAAALSSPLAQPENPDQTNSIPITISLLTKLGDESVLKIVVSISLFLCRNQFLFCLPAGQPPGKVQPSWRLPRVYKSETKKRARNTCNNFDKSLSQLKRILVTTMTNPTIQFNK